MLSLMVVGLKLRRPLNVFGLHLRHPTLVGSDLTDGFTPVTELAMYLPFESVPEGDRIYACVETLSNTIFWPAPMTWYPSGSREPERRVLFTLEQIEAADPPTISESVKNRLRRSRPGTKVYVGRGSSGKNSARYLLLLDDDEVARLREACSVLHSAAAKKAATWEKVKAVAGELLDKHDELSRLKEECELDLADVQARIFGTEKPHRPKRRKPLDKSLLNE